MKWVDFLCQKCFFLFLNNWCFTSPVYSLNFFYFFLTSNSIFYHTASSSTAWMITVWRPVTGGAPAGGFACTLLFWSQQGDGEFRRGPAALFGWMQTRRRLPCLSERQRSVHFYLTHWQASTQLSHTFHFRVYELACMQERTHARREQESENAHSCRCDGRFHFRWFHTFTAGVHLNTHLKFIWIHRKCNEMLINSCSAFF